jgi:hypothetical protein
MTTLRFFMPFTFPVAPCEFSLHFKKKPSRHPGRSSFFGQQQSILTVMGATFFNLSGLLLKGR